MGIQSLMMYLTVSSGYLIVAYLAGAQLTRSQTLFVSALFFIFASYAVWGVAKYWAAGYDALLALEELDADMMVELNYLEVNPVVIALTMGVLGIVGSLKFMWDVRHPKTE